MIKLWVNIVLSHSRTKGGVKVLCKMPMSQIRHERLT